MDSSYRKLIVGRNSCVNFSETVLLVHQIVHQLSGTEKNVFIKDWEIKSRALILNSLKFSHHLPILLQTVIGHYFDLDRCYLIVSFFPAVDKCRS